MIRQVLKSESVAPSSNKHEINLLLHKNILHAYHHLCTNSQRLISHHQHKCMLFENFESKNIFFLLEILLFLTNWPL